MRVLLLLSLLLRLCSSAQNPAPANGQSTAPANQDSPVVVVGFKSFRDRQRIEYANSAATKAPAAAMTPADKNFQKQRRINAAAGERDPNADTLDGRGAELERIVRESREPKPVVDGFAYQVKIQNASTKVIQAVIWEYQFKESLNPTNSSRREFLCGGPLKPEKGTEFRIFSKTGPSNVVSIGSLANKPKDLFEEIVVINFVEFADGSIWQRKNWNPEAAQRAFERRTVTERVSAMCIGL